MISNNSTTTSDSLGTSQEHYKYFISNIDKEHMRHSLNKNLIVPLWLPYIKGKKVLELGGGPGYFGRYIQKHCSLLSTDLSFSFLKEAQQQYAIQGVQTDITQLPFASHSFDTLVVTGVFVYFSPEQFSLLLQECRRVLKPEGHLLFHEPFAYVRWYKTLLRLLFLDFLEPTANRVYSFFAHLRGYIPQAEQEALHERPALFLRSQKEYVSAFQKEHFLPILLRPTFVNLMPARIERHLLRVSIILCPILAKIRKDVPNGIFGVVKLQAAVKISKNIAFKL